MVILKNIHPEISLMVTEQTFVSLSISLFFERVFGDDSMKKLTRKKEILNWVVSIAPINLY